MTTRLEMENQAIEERKVKALEAIERRLLDLVVAIEENTDKR